MPYYNGGTKLNTKSDINQGNAGNCYIAAAVAAHNLCNAHQTLEAVAAKVGYGMGGTSDRAFKAMGLFAFSKGTAYKGQWKGMITRAVDERIPVCLGISWRDLDGDKTGKHVIYVIGYENGVVYARDQQNNHVLISVRMADDWVSEEFVAGKRTSRECSVDWVGVGCPSAEAAKRLMG